MKENDKKGIGRPRLGAGKRRYRIAASFTLEERNRILDIAKWFDLAPSELLYRAALLLKISSPPPRVNLEAIREINAIGKNLNLIARAACSGQDLDWKTIEKYFAILSELKSVIMEKDKNGNC